MSAERPIWDRGEPVDDALLAFTTGDDWLQDQRLVVHDLAGSLAHADVLLRAGLLASADHARIRAGLEELLRSHREGTWTVEAGDEDVHSAVERRLIALAGEAGKRLHAGRSRNEQVALAVRLWLREAIGATETLLTRLVEAARAFGRAHGELPIPGYTHMRRAMPSSLADWIGAHARAFELDAAELEHARTQVRACPLGSGAGYGVPVALDRAFAARALGFEAPEEPVTLVQHARGRAELAYLTALEGIALDLGKLAADVSLFTTQEFGFLRLPEALTTGSSMMPQKRNPDPVELTRARARTVVAARAELVDLLRDLPSGYHRDFQCLKAPLFRAHDTLSALLEFWPRLIEALAPDASALRAASSDPSLRATERALERVRAGEPFRDVYRAEAAARGSRSTIRPVGRESG